MSYKSFSVDFNQLDRPTQFVDQRRLTDTNGIAALFRVKRPTEIRLHRLWVEATGTEGLRLRDPDAFVTLEVPGRPERTSELRDILIDSKDFYYNIVLDPQNIVDVENDALSSAEVTVTLGLRRRKQGPDDEPEIFNVRLDLVRAGAQPRHWIELEPAFVEGFEHVHDPAVLLGTYYLENDTAVHYAHSLDCTAYIKNERDPQPGIVSFGRRGAGTVSGRAEDVGFDDAGRLVVRQLAPRSRVAVPLLVDLTQVPCPDEETELTTQIGIDFVSNGRPASLPVCEARYRVRRNRQESALVAMVAEAGEWHPLRDDLLVHLAESTQWNPAQPGSIECFTLRIGNAADGGSGSVVVRKLNLKFQEQGEIEWAPGTTFRVNGAPLADLQQFYEFPARAGSHQDLTVSLRHDEIRNLPRDVGPVRCVVNFEYQVAVGPTATANWRGFRGEVAFQLERDLGPGWLAVDFGTSAVVVAHGALGVAGVPGLVDLQHSLQQLLPEHEHTADEVPEFGTSFVSSAVRLVPTQAFEASSRGKSIVDLAPLRRDLRNSRYAIPYVKALVGTGRLPDLTGGSLQDLEYQPTEGADAVTFGQHPITTDELLRETYARLLADYVDPAFSGPRPRKVVFSVPNSFTPRHLDLLRALIADKFPQYRREYVTFISESDAVACFYIANWTTLNQRRSEAARAALQAGDEYVLVYDMGAGTLDLTYLHIHTDTDGRKDVTIIGRMGRSTAGNYLDTMLAREIFHQHRDSFRFKMFGPFNSPEERDARHRFKQLVQSEIKPHLDEERTFVLENDLLEDDATVEVSLAELRRSTHVEEFMRESTMGVLDNFFALFPSHAGHPHRRGAVPLHTVVMSGRSMQMRLLRNAVERELREWSGSEDLYLVDDLDSQTLKSAVVQGAVQYAALYRRQTARSRVRLHNRNLQARYGILYNDPATSDRLVFKELLNPSTPPASDRPVVEHGQVIHCYDTRVAGAASDDGDLHHVDLSNTAVARFVQSFAADTAADANAGRWEYITTMAEFTVEAVAAGRPDRVEIWVTVDHENQMKVKLGRQENDPMSPLRMNLYENRMFQAGMWPFLPGESEDA